MLYCFVDGGAKILHKENGKFYYNSKKTYNSYIKKNVSTENAIYSRRSYFRGKSFPL